MGSSNLGKVADVGCGKLRHYRLLAKVAKVLYLVDTGRQMAATHHDGNQSYTIPGVAKSARRKGRAVYSMTVEEFSRTHGAIDVAFCVAVFDVVTRHRRREIAKIVSDSLREHGCFVIIAPRNDSTITRRCLEENRYQDGHVFAHHGLQTFFCNFEEYGSIVRDCGREGLKLQHDLSSYRQVCLVFRKG
jgi:SAM-dependent methyltransferase